ncbi:MAG: cytochrome c biogenesis protein CcsA [Planctomycetia bacterium]|nr:MAG: cytochrome c biogenesis protein CcsA [Planctomycetia bacterium]
MATNAIRNNAAESRQRQRDTDQPTGFGQLVRPVVSAFSSLTLTVILLAMAIFIVLAGTMAQVDKGIWQVVAEYFRTSVAWIEPRIFFPPHWFPFMPRIPGQIPFPGGWLIGLIMALNLLAAHSVRFKLQARGQRLAAGLATIGIGIVLTWFVIVSGANKDTSSGIGEIEWSTLRLLVKGGLGLVLLVALGELAVTISARGRWSRTSGLGWLARTGVVLGLGGLLGWWLLQGDTAVLNDSSLRILWQLIKGGFASLTLLGGCALVFRKRAGLVLIHAGIGLMMFGELFVGLKAVEGHMRIREGQTVNYAEEDPALELAIVDHSDPDHDDVVVIPEARLREGATIRDEALPFDVVVVRSFANSTLEAPAPGVSNPATAGTGLRQIATQAPLVSGTDNKVNLPSAYVEFRQKDGSGPLGTYLVGLLLSYEGVSERVVADGKRYDVNLRYKRTYKSYSMRLIDFRFDKYIGTSKAKNFSSDLQLLDPAQNVNRQVKIWMNNPLRYAGETFYQSGFEPASATGVETTILQVVSNRGWMIPYVACMLVLTGLLAHFWGVLLRFLRRRAAGKPAPAGREEGLGRQSGVVAGVIFPLVVVACGAALLLNAARPAAVPDGAMRLDEFGQLPVVYEGRVKPFDTLARNCLTILSDKQTAKDRSGKRQPAVRWLLDVITGTGDARRYKIFRIANLEVLQTLGLERRPGFRYSLNEISRNMEEFYRQVGLARSRDSNQLTLYQRKIVQLENKTRLYLVLEESFRPTPIRPDHQKEDLLAAMKKVRALDGYQPPPPLAVPTDSGAKKPWETFAAAWLTARSGEILGHGQANPAAVAISRVFAAYAAGDAAGFNRHVAAYRELLERNPPEQFEPAKTRFEVFFNRSQPFIWSAVLYLIAFVLASLAWLGWSHALNRAAFWLIVLTLLAHTAALVARIYISGRPPVTNLYSSAVFIGWGCVVLGLVLEVIYRMGVGNIVAAVSGFATLLIAFFLARQGDTFVVLQAVLDTQFWLATHVTTITLGYATTFLAGILGVLYVIRGVFSTTLSAEVGRNLARMIYGTICFALFFSFIGTVLGGLWADDSWGRFWGWDPKENGALIIVLWNALVLHARWNGMVRDRGMAVLAIGGNIATAWSWFGVNELGVGLHSYGFTEGVLLALGVFCLTQLLLIGVGLLPRRLWLSSRDGRNA